MELELDAHEMSDMFETGATNLKVSGIPPLTGANFEDWLDLVKTVLLSKGLWKYASGTETSRPGKAEDFEQEDAKATAYLKIAAGGQHLAYLRGLTSSKAVLDKLTTRYRVPQDERLSVLCNEFHGFTAQGGIDMSANKLTQLQLDIEAIADDEKPSDAMKKSALLRGLPSEYQSTVFALKAAGLSKISFEDMVQRLKETESSLSRRLSGEPDLARAAGGSQLKPQKDKKNVECFRCHRKGHYKRDCRSPEEEQKQHQSRGRRPTVSKPTERVNAAWGARYQAAFVLRKGLGQPQRQEWVLDSGCTRHMTYDRRHFTEFRREAGTVVLADGKILQVNGKGTIEVPIQGRMTPIVDVLYVPKIGFNLLSIGQLTARGMTCEFVGELAILSRRGETVATATRKGMTYALTAQAPEGVVRMASKLSSAELWHQRLGHPGERKTQLIATLEGAPQGLEHVNCCETCSMTKNTQSINRAPAVRATQPLGRVHIDFWGPYHEATIAGKRYMLTFTDDYTRKSWIHLTAERTDVYAVFRQWQAATELESGHRLKAVRMDNAPELVTLGGQLERAGLRVEPTVAYTPSQNGVAERLNRTLITKARALLAAAELPERLWGEAVHTANYLRNLTPLEDGRKSPEELWTGRPPKIGHLRVFGCVAYAHIPAAKRVKLKPTAAKGVFVGYALTERQYRVLDPETMFVRLHTSVEFDENQKGGQLLPEAQRRRAPPKHIEEAAVDEDDILSNIDVHHPPMVEADEAEETQATEEQPEPARQPETMVRS